MKILEIINRLLSSDYGSFPNNLLKTDIVRVNINLFQTKELNIHLKTQLSLINRLKTVYTIKDIYKYIYDTPKN